MNVLPFATPEQPRSDRFFTGVVPPAPRHSDLPRERPDPTDAAPTIMELQLAFVRAAPIWLATRDSQRRSDLTY